MWTTPRPVLSYVLAVDLLAVAATAATAGLLPITGADWTRLAILIGCSIVHVELSRSIERVRKLAAGSGPFVDGLTPWHFAAVLVLPAPLASALVVFTQTYVWLRVWRGRRPLYKWVFSAATVLLATQASAIVLAAAPGAHPGIPLGWLGIALVLVAAVLRWLINYALILGAILVSSPDLRAAQIVSEFSEQVIEAGALGLGLAAAGLLEFDPRLLVGIILGLVAMHRGVLLTQFRHASRTDGKTGLYTPTWWHQIAESALRRAVATRTSVAVLMLDLDHFKRLNDTFGHLAGDEVLRAVADAITETVRSYDAACRWGGEEFAILLPEVNVTELRAIAERIRNQVKALVLDVAATDQTAPPQVTGLTISIGGALYPSPGITGLDDLQLAADTALYGAKEAGRDRVHLASSPEVAAAHEEDEVSRQDRRHP
ncbi:GGDEF domain-containing protein [Solihabitans fulvus]|uniref:GGDEF domain-containing protein n=1 Tax=Solihabitans fulvus TaxID=1892852 RepID=A0A5B2XII6_9PSEU|nr:GGDEF domain-containing protein [Solihabitans fulvus]